MITMAISSNSLNGYLLAAFQNILNCIYIWTSVVLSSDVVVWGIVYGVIGSIDNGYIQEKRGVVVWIH